MEHKLDSPFSIDKIRGLKLGDIVYLNGEIHFSAGLPTFQRMVRYIGQQKELPFNLKNAALLHLAANTRKCRDTNEVLYVNPTTSARFNPFMPTLIKNFELRIVGGKGGLDAACTTVLKDIGCVYLAFLGGGAPIYTGAMKNNPTIYWENPAPHYQMIRIQAQELGPAIVAIDAHGNSLYEQIASNLDERYTEIVAGMTSHE